jgi:hypothetical protein
MHFEVDEIIRVKESDLNIPGEYMVIGFFNSSDDCFYSIRHLKTNNLVVRSVKDIVLENN